MKQNIFILVALANLGLFGLLFVLMHYFELMGADPQYFDTGTLNNIKYINYLTNLVGLKIDPSTQAKVSTIGYSICLGFGFVSSGFAIAVANRKDSDELETTGAV